MAVFKTTSIKETIGRLVRNTRITDSSFMDDLLEWVPEAMDKMKTRMQFTLHSKTLTITNYSAKLPCGLVHLDAVAYNGSRLREGSSVADSKNMPSVGSNNGTTTSIYVPDTDVTIENHIDSRVEGSDLTTISNSESGAYYKIQLDYIQTSFEEGEVTIYFLKRPVDKQGYPLIPDNEDYKEAIYWYGRMKMIEAGWEDPVFNWQKCFDNFYNTFAPRAIIDISYPSVDTMERIRQSESRLIPPFHLYEDFFTNAEQVQQVRK